MPEFLDYTAESSLVGTETFLVLDGTTKRATTAQLAAYVFTTKSANIQSFLNAANYGAARTALGVAIGSDVQGYSANLTTYAGIAPSSNVQSILGAANYAAVNTLLGIGTAGLLASDTDSTLAANSDSLIATQKAVKTAIATAVTGLLDFKGNTDCSASPNYPAASKGDAYVVSVAGKIGGGSGVDVDIGDMYVASADNAGGTQASVGTSWFVLEHNLVGAASAGAITASGLTMNTARVLWRTSGGSGAIEEATAANIAAFVGTNVKSTESLIIAVSDETTALTTGTGKVTFRMPYAFTVTDVRGSLTTAQTSGSIFTVDINESGTSIISTKLTIDNTELTSTTAATPAVISDSALADDAQMTVDIDSLGDGTAKGLKITLIGYRT